MTSTIPGVFVHPDERRRKGLAAMVELQAARDEAIAAIVGAVRHVIPPGFHGKLVIPVDNGVINPDTVVVELRLPQRRKS